MATNAKTKLPPCGLYRTTQALPGRENEVPQGLLVYFHNHSDSGLPVVLVPQHNIHNRWHFHGQTIAIRSLSWVSSLRTLPPQGYYMLRRELTFDGGKWPRQTLVQLGYARTGEPIAFIAQLKAGTQHNTLFFSEKGVRIRQDQLSILEGPLSIFAEKGAEESHPGPDPLPLTHLSP